jgi:hypothetical protein
MRSSDSWTLPAVEPATLKTWCGRLLVFAVSLAVFALAAGVATGERAQRDGPATSSGFTKHTPGPASSFPFGERARAREELAPPHRTLPLMPPRRRDRWRQDSFA